MKNNVLRGNFWVRFTAFFLFIVVLTSAAAGIVATIYAADSGYFVDNGASDRKDIRRNYGYKYATRILYNHLSENENILYFNSNHYYFNRNKYQVNTGNVDYDITRVSDGMTVAFSVNSETYAQIEEYAIDITYYEVTDSEKEVTDEFIVRVYFPLWTAYKDGFTFVMTLSNFLSVYKYALAASAFLLLIASVAIYIFLIRSAGISSDGTATAGFLGKIPIEIFMGIIALLETLAIGLMFAMMDSLTSEVPGVVFISVFSVIMFMWLSMSLAARFRSRTFFKYCLIWIILKAFGKLCRLIWRIYHKAGFLWRSAIIIFIVTIALLINVIIIYAEEPMGLVLMYLLWSTLTILFSIACANLAKLRKALNRLAEGDYKTKVNTFGMFFDFRRAAQNINKTFDGVTLAVDERTKSERMKTELITNVSHDIKTPLTSIVNCVDLLKNSDEEYSEQTKEYLEILDRQSRRLKKLTEDVLEASKASTGNINVELAPVDMGTLISQSLGEYSDKLEENGIKPVVNISEENIFALADGRLLWRVFDNVFSNINRYSLPGTRAYIDVFKANGIVYATFKNISSYELPSDPSELTERFVRGDSSRNTEGSGLGLSISENLCSLMGGKLTLSTEADLFKLTIALPSCSPVPKSK